MTKRERPRSKGDPKSIRQITTNYDRKSVNMQNKKNLIYMYRITIQSRFNVDFPAFNTNLRAPIMYVQRRYIIVLQILLFINVVIYTCIETI